MLREKAYLYIRDECCFCSVQMLVVLIVCIAYDYGYIQYILVIRNKTEIREALAYVGGARVQLPLTACTCTSARRTGRIAVCACLAGGTQASRALLRLSSSSIAVQIYIPLMRYVCSLLFQILT